MVRIQKRAALPESSPYRNKKYDAAFKIPLMSEDENEHGENGALTGRFVSRAPTYRSQTVSALPNPQ